MLRMNVQVGEGEKVEYRVWNPFRSKLAASVLAGVDNIHVRPGAKVCPQTPCHRCLYPFGDKLRPASCRCIVLIACGNDFIDV